MTDSYKGVRDFYPEDERIQKYIFGAMREVVESFGYEEMNASILESTDLYSKKTSEEIVSEQTYTFTDRGGRSVTLRPEMTPTVARMVAARKRELPYPLRWYSIQNFFRYERPQRGRGREFWQLNADLFGVSDIFGDAEIIEIAYRIMRKLGAEDSMFEIRIGSRKALEAAMKGAGLSDESAKTYKTLLDKKSKMTDAEYQEGVRAITSKDPLEFMEGDEATKELDALFEMLRKRGIPAVKDFSVVRGFEYYTDIVFEIFDTDPENNRSLFGGGRYDTLIEKYGSEGVPAVGFAMGDLTAKDFLETHKLLPSLPPRTHLYIGPVSASNTEDAEALANELRKEGLNVAVGLKHEKFGDHIKTAVKLGIPYFIAYGEKEKTAGEVDIKELSTEKETRMTLEKIVSFIKVATSR